MNAFETIQPVAITDVTQDEYGVILTMKVDDGRWIRLQLTSDCWDQLKEELKKD